MKEATTDRALAERDKAFLAHVSELAADPDNRIFAVMDGAFFDNIGSTLRDAGLTRRPLYRYGGNQAVVVGGPWLVNPYQDNPAAEPRAPAWAQISEEERATGKSDSEIYAGRVQAALEAGDETGGGMLPLDEVENVPATVARLEAILRIAEGKPGLVFWIGDASLTEEDLYRHLRRLNKMLIPNDQDGDGDTVGELSEAAADADEIPTPKQADAYELVIFRHADANVMAQVFPALNDVQAARLFGPCRQILFAPDPDWDGGVKRARKPDNLPEPPSGPLRLEPETMRAISVRRLQGHHRKIMTYLRKVSPEQTQELDDTALAKQVMQSTDEAAGFGLKSEAAHCRWAYLSLATNGRISKDSSVREFMTASTPGYSADDRVRLLMKQTIYSTAR